MDRVAASLQRDGLQAEGSDRDLRRDRRSNSALFLAPARRSPWRRFLLRHG